MAIKHEFFLPYGENFHVAGALITTAIYNHFEASMIFGSLLWLFKLPREESPQEVFESGQCETVGIKLYSHKNRLFSNEMYCKRKTSLPETKDCTFIN